MKRGMTGCAQHN
ncbi:hypothetical protein N7505_008006 [Penicillium chrysogenum]|uniref:Uncharacterized protein n=1 Tax=Penicillium chrysogenum TaxID=5076 RepID=A0ABQ8WCD5_PENCH|nr:hypothetical protein N7505_008006 [Penicillium chrysogenum]